LFQVLWAVVGIVIAVLLALRWRRTLNAALNDTIVWLLIGYAFLTVAWSLDPWLTVRKTIAIASASLVGLYMGSRFNIRDQLRLIVVTIALAAVMSILCVVAAPGYGIQSVPHTGAWRGVFAHKNSLGMLMTLGMASMILVPARTALERAGIWSGWLLCVLLILMSTSQSAMVISIVVLGMIALVKVFRAKGPARILIVSALLPAIAWSGYLLWSHLDSALDLLGRDVTLTGRTGLWGAVVDAISARWLLGYGYGTFWAETGGPSASVAAHVGWDPAHAHNGFLDLWLDVGMVGCAVLSVGLAKALYRGGRLALNARYLVDLWPAIFLLFILLYNCVESALLRRNVFWVLYVATVTTLSRAPGKVSTANSAHT